MKNYLFFIFSLCILASFASCQEQDFASDFGFESSDDLRATISAEKVARDLTKSLGYEVDHQAGQFGFDVAAQALSLATTRAAATRANYNALSSGVYNPEENIRTIAQNYGTVQNITESEHKEVYEWFTNHKVEWENTPVNYEGTATRQIVGGNGVYGVAKALKPENYERYGSLRNYNINQLGDATVGAAIHFNYAWIQRVASDADKDFGYDQPLDEIAIDGSNPIYGGDKFNQLGVWDGSKWIHTYNFNGQSGYGWGRQNEKRDGYQKNGVFFCNVDCSQLTAQASSGGSMDHDKWIIVSLKGDDYEGTYIGFDFESAGINSSEKYKANGICNDWIIKITPSTTDITKFENYRIMCEDLGASFDVDYNDLVIDVDWDSFIVGGFDPQLRARIVSACGSLPISIWIDQPSLIPPFHNYVYSGEVHELLGGEMKDDGTYEPIKPNQITNSPVIQASRGLFTSGKSEDLINAIDIKVCQDPAAWKQAKEKGKMTEKAIWTSVHNFAGKIPLKICVPQCVKIATESGIDGDRRFEKAYPMFPKWLKNEATYSGTGFPFWEICDERWVYSN